MSTHPVCGQPIRRSAYGRLMGLARGVLRRCGAERIALARVPRAHCDVSRLGYLTESELASAWGRAGWEADGTVRDAAGLPDSAGGVNLGDQRALYQLVRALAPGRVLEVGTHIGCSTLCLALAAARNTAEGRVCTIDTVDIRDTNDEVAKPWVHFGARRSPRDTLRSVGLERFVNFHVSDARAWMRQTATQYGLIFLDGNHNADCVYQELPLALSRLAAGGTIVLHDFFPEGRALWRDGYVIGGPWLAISRYAREHAGLRVLPLGELPWPTKLGGCVTSLAVISSAQVPAKPCPTPAQQQSGPFISSNQGG